MKKSVALILLLLACNVIYSQNEGTFTDSRDGKIYKWVKIGDQVWMAENLAYLPSVYSIFDEQTFAYADREYNMDVMNNPYQFVPGYTGDNVNEAKQTEFYQIYGVLYNHAAAIELCPSGWHLPSDEEWKELEGFIGLDDEIIESMGFERGELGGRLKSTQFWEEEVRGSDDYGFCAIPAGIVLQNPSYEEGAVYRGEGTIASFWTSDKHQVLNMEIAAIRRAFDNSDLLLPKENQSIIRYPISKNFAFSVRCVKDK